MMSLALQVAGTVMALQVAGWAVAAALATEIFYDITGALTYVLATFTVHQARHGSIFPVTNTALFGDKSFILEVMVLFWSVRLGAFLFWRVKFLTGKDSRFDKVKKEPLVFLFFWLMQGAWCCLMLLPLILAPEGEPAVNKTMDVFGLSLFVLGYTVECVADWQKTRFRMNPANKGRFVRTGLWSVVRYPNYAGEITLHCGMALYCGHPFAFLAPAFAAFLLIRLSGIPLQERQAKRRWGEERAYKEYVSNTPHLLFPGLY